MVGDGSLERDKSKRDATTEMDALEGEAVGSGGVAYGAHTKVVEENAILAKQLLETQVRNSRWCQGLSAMTFLAMLTSLWHQEQVRSLTSQLETAKNELRTSSTEPSQQDLLQQNAVLERELKNINAKRVEAQVYCPHQYLWYCVGGSHDCVCPCVRAC